VKGAAHARLSAEEVEGKPCGEVPKAPPHGCSIVN